MGEETQGPHIHPSTEPCHYRYFSLQLQLAVSLYCATSASNSLCAKISFRDGDMVSCLKRRKYENFIWVVSNDIK